MLVTPLRDGMNLVAKEYVAARADEHGVLVLSEFAGAARELGEALLVNPYDIDGDRGGHRACARHARGGTARAERGHADAPASVRRRPLGRRAARARSSARGPRRARCGERRSAPRDRARLVGARGGRVSSSPAPRLRRDAGTASPRDPGTPCRTRRSSRCSTRLAADAGDRRRPDQRARRDDARAWFGRVPLSLVAEHGARSATAGGAWERAACGRGRGVARVVGR